ncbi:MAG: hypothetical protein LBS69_06445 [Prevotellaceae bacterium]|nr:hypothetical protein [Prevotellaceae bacterium]
MKKFFLTFAFLLTTINLLFTQESISNLKIISVNKQVKEILYDSHFYSPLNSYIASIQFWISGKYNDSFSEMIPCSLKKDTEPASTKYAENLLNSTIEDVIIYNDSLGFAIRKETENKWLIIGCSVLENGQWKFTGEDICFSSKLGDAHKHVIEKSISIFLPSLRKYYQQTKVSTDTLSFEKYLHAYGKNPQEYLLNKLSEYKLVGYGETHRRKVSWDFLKNLVQNTKFAETCGTVFMELPYHTQKRFDEFLESDTLNNRLILEILGMEQIYGWQDKGMYEFIETIWRINKNLQNKIKIVAVDFQIPWDSITTNDDYEYYIHNKMKDRDNIMADIVEKTIRTKIDNRNCLFIVGMNHARKSSPDFPVKAGTLLAQKFSRNDIFSIMTHTMISDNSNFCGKIRYGFFDYIFERNGNIPVAFDIFDSPFGKESFDAVQNVRFEAECGNYEDFYDGYIFLSPLENEEYDYTLFELFTDGFIEELKRRAYITNSKYGWYDIFVDELTKEKIIDKIKEDILAKGNKRFD